MRRAGVEKSVLMIGPCLESRGGMATVEQQLVNLLPEFGVRLHFIGTYDDCSDLKKAIIAAVAYARFCKMLPRFDIVHVHMASRGSYRRKRIFIVKALKERKKVIVHLHGGEFAKWYEAELEEKDRDDIKSLFSHIDALIVLSEEWRDWVLENVCTPKNLIVMHNGVNLPSCACDPCSHQDVLFLGRLDANKSPDVLLRASRESLEKHPEAKLIFGGDGHPERYKKLADELGIADRCEFLGWVVGEDKELLFRRAGVYCLPSKNEGMPMSVLEAMAHGIPAVSTPVGGVPQVIENGVDGFLFPVDDEKRLSEIIGSLLDDPDLRKRIGSAGRAKIAERFDVETGVGQLVDLYERICK